MIPGGFLTPKCYKEMQKETGHWRLISMGLAIIGIDVII